MKKILLLILFVLIVPIAALGQAVVNDPALIEVTTNNWSTQLAKAAEQYEKLKQQTSLLQEGIDKYKKVNNTIKNGKRVKELIDKQVNLISMLSDELGKVNKSVTNVDAHQSYVRRLNNIMNSSKNNVIALTEILTDSKLNLSDYERMKLLEDLDQKSDALLINLNSEKRKYDKLNSTIEEIERLRTKKK